MKTFRLVLAIGLFLHPSRAIFAEGEDLEAALKAWEAAADRATGRVVVSSRLRQSIGMERTTKGAMLKERPSMAFGQPPPTRIAYKRLPRPIEVKARIESRFDTKELRIDLTPSASTGPAAKRFSGAWNGGWWEEGSGGTAPAAAEFGDDAIRQPFGILYSCSYRDAAPGRRFVDLIRRRSSTVGRDGELLKIHAPAKAGAPPEGGDFTFWLDPAKGMLPARWQRGAPGEPVEVRVENRIEEVQPGIWAPTRISARMFVPDPLSPLRDKVVFESDQEVDRKASGFGEPLAPVAPDGADRAAGASTRAGRSWAIAPVIVVALGVSMVFGWRRLRNRRGRLDSGSGRRALR